MKKEQQKHLGTVLLLFSICVLSLCLAGCSTGTEKALLAVEEYPVMDGSTANLPLMAEVMSQVCGISYEEAEQLTSCTTTPNAWLSLINGTADILLVYEPATSTKETIEQSGVDLDIQPIGRDALVFINNESNPVGNLTSQQLVDIYSGKITNWQEVGGENKEIIAYQRSEDSGSQSLFMKLLMKDVAPMKAPTELAPAEMGMLIDRLAGYNNSANAVGYSVYYYAKNMYNQPGLKFLAVDGVTPSDTSLEEGNYPFINDFYVVIRSDEPADSPTRQLRDWILSEDGVAALRKAGYIPIARQ